jgi:hypothetical protein
MSASNATEYVKPKEGFKLFRILTNKEMKQAQSRGTVPETGASPKKSRKREAAEMISASTPQASDTDRATRGNLRDYLLTVTDGVKELGMESRRLSGQCIVSTLIAVNLRVDTD